MEITEGSHSSKEDQFKMTTDMEIKGILDLLNQMLMRRTIRKLQRQTRAKSILEDIMKKLVKMFKLGEEAAISIMLLRRI